ncbi:ferritin-like domain-containing protein [Kribbella sp. NPDC048915]|uniref:ferritin-like domain-containing protein n=1 Tax=Kribbella sp. NPDC048915 TaxID=3155148 RepID=UPI0033F0E82C
MNQVEALQAALAGEHAALYGVGVAGGKLRGSRFTAATAAFETHRTRRDRLSALLVAAGETPAAAEPAYTLPRPVTNAATATALVLVVEQRIAAVYGDLVEAAEDAAVRIFAVESLLDAASRQLAWGGAPVAFPGAAP